MTTENKETAFQKIGNSVLEWLIKAILTFIGILVLYLLFRYFVELEINDIKFKLINSESKINCPKKIQLYTIFNTNKRKGKVKYRFYDEQEGKDLGGQYELKITDSDTIYKSDTLTTEIKSTARITIKYEISYSDFLGFFIPDVIKEYTINKKDVSESFKIECMNNPIDREMVYIEGGNYKRIILNEGENVKFEQVKVDGFHIDIEEVSYFEYFNFINKPGQSNILPMTSQFSPSSKDEVIQYGRQFPILGIEWLEAKKYCESVGKRLPTIKEWEFLAYGGIYPDKDNAQIYVDLRKNTIYDMTENSIGVKGIINPVYEWCYDSDPNNKNLKAIKGSEFQNENYDFYYTKFINSNSDLSKIGCRCAK